MSTIAPSPLPQWDLTAAFPSLDAPEFHAAFERIKRDISRYAELLDRLEKQGVPVTAAFAKSFDELIEFANDLRRQIRTMNSFIGGHVSTNSRDELALARESEMEVALIPYAKLTTRFNALIGSLPLDELLAQSKAAADHEYPLRKAAIIAKHLMSPDEESLMAELAPTAIGGWEKLHNNITSQIEVEVELKSELRRMPMSMIRNLAYDADRDVRQTAYEAEIRAWNQHEVPIAAAINGIKGTVSTASRRRGWESPLEQALFFANIDQKTLDAMMQAARESFPDFRRYMNAKAKRLGLAKLAFFDIFAPLKGGERSWNYDDGAQFVAKHFYSFSDKLGQFAERAFKENWIDAEPHAGKQDGAYCMWLIGDQSRVLMNYKTAFGSVKTLAHELGHAYHNLCLTDRTMLQRQTPMTLAETASIFCETIVQHAALAEASAHERVSLLEGSLQGICQVVVDITSRFLFEQKVFEGREKRDLSAKEFCQLMVQAQKDTYGDGLDEKQLHPYMWAVKPHYYSASSFYNFPYMYGLLFGLGLYSQYKKDPEAFKSRYDDLLSSTGLADAATLGKQFGIDVRTPEFWRSSLDVIREQIVMFEESVK